MRMGQTTFADEVNHHGQIPIGVASIDALAVGLGFKLVDAMFRAGETWQV